MDLRAYEAVTIATALAFVALALRVLIHVGTTPGGVDTWYFLESARELRRTRRLPISLPRYLLGDRTESYPPGFVVLLALIPERILARAYWLLSPMIDAIHLVLLFTITLRLTGSIAAAAIAGAVYAITPQLISETRNLNPRAFAVLLSSVAMLLAIRSVLPVAPGDPARLGQSPVIVALLTPVAIAALLLTHTLTSLAFALSTAILSIVFQDPRFAAFTLVGFAIAIAVSRGLYLRVLWNHVESARFRRRNSVYLTTHPVEGSPVYGAGAARSGPIEQGWASRAVRVLGENPFIVPMLITPLPVLAVEWWGQRMWWWAVTILVWSLLVTFVRPLHLFGPGYLYMKASVFPTGFSLALAVGSLGGLRSPISGAVLVSALASLAAIAYFYRYIRSRRTEHTATLPPDLREIARRLAASAGDGVLCLPTMYADYVAYATGKRVLWGGHSGDLTRFQAMSPVIQEPLEVLAARYGLRFALFDLAYVTPDRLGLASRLQLIERAGGFALYRWTAG
jgi:hypothetical protein